MEISSPHYKVLALDTSGPSLSVALAEGNQSVYSARVALDKAHNVLLGELADQGLRFLGWKPADLNAIALSAGPGSYTGIRIGTSFAKGLCFGLGIPFFPFSSLACTIWAARETKTQPISVLAAFDARRSEVYLRLEDEKGHTQVGDLAANLGETPLPQLEPALPLLLAGSGAEKIFRFFGTPSAWECQPDIEPDARFLIPLLHHQKPGPTDPGPFEPQYLKPVHFTQAKS
jgi:tRNA threonylcarbamoyladenosine biosynthesis protein TsaB